MSVQYSAIHDGMPYFNKNYPTQEQIDAVIAARRNPLTPQMERAKSVALKKYSVPKIKDVVYHLALKFGDSEAIPVYVGITSEDRIDSRKSEHFKGIQDQTNLKNAYIFIRDMELEGFTPVFEVVGDASEITETDLLIQYIELGYPIQNELGKTVSIKRKKKKLEDVTKALTPKQTANKAFKQMMSNPTKLDFKKAK